MVQYWEPGTQYNYGDVVEYQGHKYKIVQPHRSQSDWAPDLTPALWGKLQDGDCGNSGNSGHSSRQEYQPQYQQQDSYQQPAPQYGGEKHSEHHGKLDEAKEWAQEHKQGLEIAGGLAGAAGLVAAGTAAYKHHQQSQQNEQEQGYQQQYNQTQPHHPNKVDEAKNWAQEHKTGLGIAAGAALLGGAALAYKHHQHEKEQEQRDD